MQDIVFLLAIIHSLKFVDYLSVHTHKPYNNLCIYSAIGQLSKIKFLNYYTSTFLITVLPAKSDSDACFVSNIIRDL